MSAPPGGPPAGPRLTALDRAPRAGAHERDENYQPVFVNARRTELDELLTRYPAKMAALLPALWIVQEERGWVSEPAMAEVAAVLGLTPAYVKGVVTFYTMYHQHPVGKPAPPRPRRPESFTVCTRAAGVIASACSKAR